MDIMRLQREAQHDRYEGGVILRKKEENSPFFKAYWATRPSLEAAFVPRLMQQPLDYTILVFFPWFSSLAILSQMFFLNTVSNVVTKPRGQIKTNCTLQWTDWSELSRSWTADHRDRCACLPVVHILISLLGTPWILIPEYTTSKSERTAKTKINFVF